MRKYHHRYNAGIIIRVIITGVDITAHHIQGIRLIQTHTVTDMAIGGPRLVGSHRIKRQRLQDCRQ